MYLFLLGDEERDEIYVGDIGRAILPYRFDCFCLFDRFYALAAYKNPPPAFFLFIIFP